MKQTTVYKLLILIVVLGAILRFTSLGTNSLVADEFLDMNSSYGYFQTGEWRAWDFNYGKESGVNINEARDERAFVYKWQVAGLFQVLPPTEATARMVSVLWGIISIFLMYWTGYFYTRKKSIGLLSAFFFAVSISGIIFDRRLRMYAMFFPVYLALATVLFAFFESAYQGKIGIIKKIWGRYGINTLYVLPLVLLLGINALTHGLALTIIPVFALYVLSMVILTWRRDRVYMNKYSALLGLLFLGALTALLFFPHLVRLGLGNLVWFDNHYSYIGYVLRDFAHPLLGSIALFFGSYVLYRKLNKQKEALWLTLSYAIPLILAIWFWSRNAGPQYIFFIQSFVLILTATGVYGVVTFVKEHLPTLGKSAPLLCVLLLLVLLPNYGYFLEENNTYHETSTGSNPNYRKVFAYFKKNQLPTDVLVTRNVRNYYLSGAHVPVYDLGDEISRTRLTIEDLERLMREYSTGWVILSDNDYDYVGKGVKDFLYRNLTRVSNDQVRGSIDVFIWGH